MRSEHSRHAFAALDKVIDRSYIKSVTKENCMIVNLSDVIWARDAGFSMSVIRAALKDAADGFANFPDSCVFNELLQSIGE
jgi:hypothetical protein